jgi:hypothetical protein
MGPSSLKVPRTQLIAPYQRPLILMSNAYLTIRAGAATASTEADPLVTTFRCPAAS